MPRSRLTGSRIRERRLALGVQQAALARTVGISAAYLNLIEHNRRRIGGKLLLDIARALSVEADTLTEGAELALIEALEAAALGHPVVAVEADRGDELADRFPGWAQLLAAQARRIEGLERTTAALTDRLAHDPQLAASIHEVLSVATAIRSTAGILANDTDMDPEWQGRFHRNLYEDSQRLADSAQALVAYLDVAAQEQPETRLSLPQEELEGWFAASGHRVEALETGGDVDAVLAQTPALTAAPATRVLARAHLARYSEDARAMPEDACRHLLASVGPNPIALAAHFNVGIDTVLRRLSVLVDGAGLVQCDASGALTFRKPVDGFSLPQYGAACPMWPLYQALGRPMFPLRTVLEQAGPLKLQFLAYSVATPVGPPGFDMPPVLEATMLILPREAAAWSADHPVVPVGPGCRICAREDCAARREPSILTTGY